MRIIHTADIHIGSALRGLPPEKAELRKTEILDGFRRLCAYARDNGVAVVLIAGDLFDENRVTRQTKRQTLSFIEQAKPTAFFYVSGNHDDSGLENEPLPDNLYVFTQNHDATTYRLEGNIAVTGMDTRYFSLQNFDKLRFPMDAFNILLLHGDVSTDKGREYIPLGALQNKGVDYLALGHIHIPDLQCKPLDSRGVYRYAGCPEGRGFDEIGGRGFFQLEIDGGRIVSERFLTLAKRSVHEKQVDISACQTYFDVENAVFTALQQVSADDMVKIVLCGSFEPDLKKDLTVLSARLNERFFFAKVEDISRLHIDPESFAADLTERGEFVREAARYTMDDAIRDEILEVGLKALAGEDIDL